MFEIAFTLIKTITCGLATVLYDVIIATITGYIVWYKTDEYMQRRTEKELYIQEQQAYSRYLGTINILIKHYDTGNKSLRIAIETLLEDAPIRSHFRPSSEQESAVFEDISRLLSEIQGCLVVSKNMHIDLMKLSSKVSNCRRQILSFSIEQPAVQYWKFWGAPATAEAYRSSKARISTTKNRSA